jgi:hypothetical protein
VYLEKGINTLKEDLNMFDAFKNLFDFVAGPNGITITMNPYAIFIVFVLVVFAYLFIRANRSGRLDWTDMITYTGPSNQVSLTKVLQLVGGITATWIMIYTTLHDKLSVDLLLAYLTYVGAIEGWSRFISAKYGVAETGTHNSLPSRPNAVDLDAALPKGDK